MAPFPVLTAQDVLPASSPATEAEEEDLYQLLGHIPIELCGYLKADASYDSSETSTGDFVRWLEPGGDGNGQLQVTSRQSRFGLNFEGPESYGVKTSGRLELDFFPGRTSNSANPRLRHAYVVVDVPEYDLSVLAGQSRDVISPLVPSTVNDTVAWWAGDQGFRRNQVRLTKGVDLSEDLRLLFQLAAARSIGGDARVPGTRPLVAAGSRGQGHARGLRAREAREHLHRR